MTSTMIESPRVGDFDYVSVTEIERRMCLHAHRPDGSWTTFLCTRQRRHVGDHAFGHDGIIRAVWS